MLGQSEQSCLQAQGGVLFAPSAVTVTRADGSSLLGSSSRCSADWGNVLNNHDKYTSYTVTVNSKQVAYATPQGDDLPLSIGAIVGIAVSALVIVILIIVLIVLACRKQRKDKPRRNR